MKYRLEIDNQSHKVEIVKNQSGKLEEIFIDDQKFNPATLKNFKDVDLEGKDNVFQLSHKNSKYEIKLKPIDSTLAGLNKTESSSLDQMKEFFKEGKLFSPMPGKIVDIRYPEGSVVEKGKVILSLEAMKMENEIVVPFSLKITKVLVSITDSVTDKQILAEYEQIT